MIKEYKKAIIMSVTLIALIAALAWLLTTDIDFGLFKNISIANISEKKVTVETLMSNEIVETERYTTSLNSLDAVKTQYDAAKETFENIDKATIDLVKEATTDEQYFIEYLWIVLGNYAQDNKLAINIITPGSSSATTNNGEGEASKPVIDTNVQNNAIKLVVRGRYGNVADFVYEVENDKELKFKLDNIKMTYTADNAIEATFNVLSLKVKK